MSTREPLKRIVSLTSCFNCLNFTLRIEPISLSTSPCFFPSKVNCNITIKESFENWSCPVLKYIRAFSPLTCSRVEVEILISLNDQRIGDRWGQPVVFSCRQLEKARYWGIAAVISYSCTDGLKIGTFTLSTSGHEVLYDSCTIKEVSVRCSLARRLKLWSGIQVSSQLKISGVTISSSTLKSILSTAIPSAEPLTLT